MNNNKTSDFAVGDKVNHPSLGDGVVTKLGEADYLIQVEYKKRPPIECNMGENPTWELVSQLQRITQ